LETVTVPIHILLHLYKPAPGSFISLIPFLQPLATAQLSFSLMASSSSSTSSAISFESESTREATPEYDPIAAYEACAPLHWDAEEWDFQT
jgi:hypothetical protein